MKHLLKEGEISLLLPEGKGGGLSGEVHSIKHRKPNPLSEETKALLGLKK